MNLTKLTNSVFHFPGWQRRTSSEQWQTSRPLYRRRLVQSRTHFRGLLQHRFSSEMDYQHDKTQFFRRWSQRHFLTPLYEFCTRFYDDCNENSNNYEAFQDFNSDTTVEFNGSYKDNYVLIKITTRDLHAKEFRQNLIYGNITFSYTILS